MCLFIVFAYYCSIDLWFITSEVDGLLMLTIENSLLTALNLNDGVNRGELCRRVLIFIFG